MVYKKEANQLKITILVVAFVYVLVGTVYTLKSPPKGDEIHYLISVVSLAKDYDLDIGNNYENRDYAVYYDTKLDRHSVKGRLPGEYMFHGLGLYPLLLLPGYLLLDRAGVVTTIVACALALLLLTYRYVIVLTNSQKASILALVSIALSLPFIQYSSLMFPDIFACTIVVLVTLSLLKRSSLTLSSSLLIGILLWIHVRYLPISGGLLLSSFFAMRKKKRTISSIAIVAPGAFLAISYFAFYAFVFGSPDMREAYKQAGLSTEPGSIYQNIILALVDRQYGLFVYSPAYLLLLSGLVIWWNKHKKSLLYVLPATLFYLLLTFSYFDWNGGYSPPGRYLIPVIPILAPALGFALATTNRILKKYLYLSVAWGLFSFSLLYFKPPNWGFVYMDGHSPLFSFISSVTGIARINTFFPAFYPSKQFAFTHLVVLACALGVLLGLYLLPIFFKKSVSIENKTRAKTKNSKE